MHPLGTGRTKGSTIETTPALPMIDGSRQSLLIGVVKTGILLCGLLAAGLLVHAMPALRHLLASPELLAAGWRGWIIFLCIGTLIGAVGLPRQAVGFAGGFLYGSMTGIVLATAANLLSGLAGLLWARLVGRNWVLHRLRGHSERLGRAAKLEAFVSANPFTAILTLRLLPVGSSLLVSLLAGVLGVRIAPFMAATLLGGLPQTVIFVLAGSGSRIGQMTQLGLAAGLFAASGLCGILLLRSTQSSSGVKTEKST